jgi:DNA-binding transcriptional LysR family regulator
VDPRFTLRQIRYFLAAAKAGSVNQAAFNINISAPAVSSAINQLEEQYRVRLFVRHHSQGLILTEEGKRFFHAAEELFTQAQYLESSAQGLGNTMPSDIHAGCFISLAPIIIPLLSKRIAQDFPGTRLSFHEGSQALLFDWLRTGTISFAFTYNFNVDQDLHFETLKEVPPYCILPPTHRLAKSPEIHLRELEGDPMILLDLPKSYNYYMSLFSYFNIRPHIAHKTTSPEVVRVMVSHGLGYSVLSMPSRHSLAMDGSEFVLLPLGGNPPNLSVGLVSSIETTSTYTYKTIFSIAKNCLGLHQ